MMEGEKMIKKKSNMQPGENSLAKFKKQQIFYLPTLLFGIILFIMSVSRVYAADNAVYSTVGGTWEKVSDELSVHAIAAMLSVPKSSPAI